MAADLKMAPWKWIEALPAVDVPQNQARNPGRAVIHPRPQRPVSLPALRPPSQQQSQRSNGMPTWAKLAVALVVLVIVGLIGYAVYMLYLAVVENPVPFLFTVVIIAVVIYRETRGK